MSVPNKKVFIAVLLHFFIFAVLHTATFMIPPSFSMVWLNFPFGRWLIWVVPSFILIKIFQKDLHIGLKEMFCNKVRCKTFSWCILPLVVYLVAGILLSKYLNIGMPLSSFENAGEFFSTLVSSSYGALVSPAITEEMVFRAWIQNALIGKIPNRKRIILAIVISNILFVLIHLPTYIYVYHYSILQMITEGLSVFVLGCAFGIMFSKSKNIFVPIFAHWLCDTVSFTFFC